MEQTLYWLAGGLGVPLIQWLKEKLGWEGRAALALTAAMAALLAILALFLSRELALSDFTLANLAAATLAYKMLNSEG